MSDDLDAWLEEYRPYTTSAKVCGRADLIAEHARRDLALVQLRAEDGEMLASKRVADAKAAVQEIEAEIEGAQREFKFRGVGNKAWQDLKKAHPPSDSDRRDGLDVSMETFAPALIAATSYAPGITEAQAGVMLVKFPPGEFQKLFDAAMEANGQVTGTPKSVMAALIDQARRNGGSSITALPEASPAASSSDASDDQSTD